MTLETLSWCRATVLREVVEPDQGLQARTVARLPDSQVSFSWDHAFSVGSAVRHASHGS